MTLAEGWEYAVNGEWLVVTTTKCTCDGGIHGHERHCGIEPCEKLSVLLDQHQRITTALRALDSWAQVYGENHVLIKDVREALRGST